MNNATTPRPGSSNRAGRDNIGLQQHGKRIEQQGGDPPQQGHENRQLGGRIVPQSQGHADYGPPPPPPKRYNVWGMDYSPYDRGGPLAEESGTNVPEVPRRSQSSDFGPPPPPPKRYNVWGMDYSPYDQGESAPQQSRQVRPPPDLSGTPPPAEPYGVSEMDYSPYQQGSGGSVHDNDNGQGSGGVQSSGQDKRRKRR